LLASAYMQRSVSLLLKQNYEREILFAGGLFGKRKSNAS